MPVRVTQPGGRSRNGDAALTLQPRADLCLAFANTLSWRGREQASEALQDFTALVSWLEKETGFAPKAAQTAARWSAGHPVDAARLLAEAIELREVIHRVANALISGQAVSNADLAGLNRVLGVAPPRDQLARTPHGFAWRVAQFQATVPVLLAPVLWSAADLLVAGDTRGLRRCANPECLWLFIDASKSGNRRWCDMASCGNRAKAARHYLKRKRV